MSEIFKKAIELKDAELDAVNGGVTLTDGNLAEGWITVKLDAGENPITALAGFIANNGITLDANSQAIVNQAAQTMVTNGYNRCTIHFDPDTLAVLAVDNFSSTSSKATATAI